MRRAGREREGVQKDRGERVKEEKEGAPEKRASRTPACLESAAGASQCVLCVSQSPNRGYAL